MTIEQNEETLTFKHMGFVVSIVKKDNHYETWINDVVLTIKDELKPLKMCDARIYAVSYIEGYVDATRYFHRKK